MRCVCACVREKDVFMCVLERECVCARVRESVCVCVFVCEKESAQKGEKRNGSMYVFA